MSSENRGMSVTSERPDDILPPTASEVFTILSVVPLSKEVMPMNPFFDSED
jgi:hypothetical protein